METDTSTDIAPREKDTTQVEQNKIAEKQVMLLMQVEQKNRVAKNQHLQSTDTEG